jgi:hypothetical protein
MLINVIFLIFTSISHATVGAYGLDSRKIPGNETDVVAIRNMPRVRSQDSVGLCASFAAATLIDEAKCVQDGENNCAAVSDDKKVAPLDLSRFSEVMGDNADSRYAYDKIKEGGYTPLILNNAAIESRKVVKESCAPFDQITAGIDDPRLLEKSIWGRFNEVYEKNKSVSSTEAEFCPTCEAAAKEVKEEYALKASNKDVLESFGKKTYGEFMDRLLIPTECTGRKNVLRLENLSLGVFPEKNSFDPKDTEKQKIEKTVQKIKSVLGRKRPMSLDYCGSVPLDRQKVKKISQCKDGHAIVIKGYKKVCKTGAKSECRNMLQVQNSWGQKWQDDNNNDWVDGDELIKRSLFETSSFAWLDIKPVEAAAVQ